MLLSWFYLLLFPNSIFFYDFIIFMTNDFVRRDIYLYFDLKFCSWDVLKICQHLSKNCCYWLFKDFFEKPLVNFSQMRQVPQNIYNVPLIAYLKISAKRKVMCLLEPFFRTVMMKNLLPAPAFSRIFGQLIYIRMW